MAQFSAKQAAQKRDKYLEISRQFALKYGADFDVFRQRLLAGELSAEEEQDYFDWELAITFVEDVEIKKLAEKYQMDDIKWVTGS